jgi:signal transduction histidine kinase
VRDRLVDRWAQALRATSPTDRQRLNTTLDNLLEALDASNTNYQAGAGGVVELCELRARLVEIAGEERSLSTPATAALHRALDTLLLREASLAAPDTDAEERTSFHDRFVALLGHDLRNPISAVKLATSILARDTQSPEARRRTLQRVTSNTDRLLRTLEDSLDYSRLYQGRELAIEAVRIDIDATGRGVLAALEAAYPTRTFVYESPGPIEGLLDKERFVRLLSNLLVAAVEHASPDSETRLRLTGKDGIRLTVESTGFELTTSELEHLFDSPLSETKDKARRPRGFGVGLFVGQRVIAQHGGTLRAEPLTPSGTAFVITLPIAI